MSAAQPFLGDKPSILCLSFSADYTSFGVGTSSGFRVFSTEPPAPRFSRDPFLPNPGGIGQIQLVYNSSIVLLVGGGTNPKFPQNKVMVWDEDSQQMLAEVEVQSSIGAIRLAHDRLFVATTGRIAVFSLAANDMFLTEFETDMSLGGAAFATSSAPFCAAYALPKAGSVMLRQQRERGAADPLWPHTAHTTERTVSVATSSVNFIALNHDGTLFATASEIGTIVRVWDTRKLTQTHQFRRGTSEAQITEIVFSPDSSLLLVLSSSLTVHVFSLSSNIANRTNFAVRAESWWPFSSATVSTELDCFSFTASTRPSLCCFGRPTADPTELCIITISQQGVWCKNQLQIRQGVIERVCPPTEYTFIEDQQLSELLAGQSSEPNFR